MRFTKKRNLIWTLKAKYRKIGKALKIAGHSENEIIPTKMRTSGKMEKSSETKINETTNLGVSWDPIHVAIKITTCYFICQGPWTFTREEYSILGISNERF